MKQQIKQLLHSPKFVIGACIFLFMLLFSLIYPLFNHSDPLQMIGQGTFFAPGTYISTQEAIGTKQYTMNIQAGDSKLESAMDMPTRARMAEWLEKYGGVKAADIDVTNAKSLAKLWEQNYDSKNPQKGLTSAKKRDYRTLDKTIKAAMSDADTIIATKDAQSGSLVQSSTISATDYINAKEIKGKKTFVLGTDNFGRDVLTELVSATKTSLKIGFIAGLIATGIGLILGLLSGYIGGTCDDFIMFITNLFTVIPSFILLILISYSIGKSGRGVMMVAFIIGLTSWTWTCRSVRSQVISLRNRDHVNLSKLSGHSLGRIIFMDILPYIASYVVMALILQISSGILSEAQLSMLGLGPATTKIATLGLMMNWAMTYSAHLNGQWWAFMPVILDIALISFSLNLMNTGMDQVFNPQLRD
jgi:ABC-type dipeptide/oligopeptide/nickel transport system permease subunit